MKNSTSLTSLSSVDKDYSLGSLTQFGRNASSQRLIGSPQSARKSKQEQSILEEDLPFQQRANAVPSLPRKKRRRRRDLITANLSGTRYEVVRQMVDKMGYSVSKDDDPLSYLIWNDSFVSLDKISELKQYQRINHFPGMGEITRKDALARNYSKMQKVLPDEFNFMPKTWTLPADYSVLQSHAKEMRGKRKSTTYIAKPSNGAQGHGIALYRNAEKIPPQEHFIVQEYIDKPLLLDGYKFDLRIYVLLTSCDPLRIFLFNDGLVRLATEKYLPPHESNINHLYMHLTNYSVNKHNEFYEKGSSFDTGSKRSIKYLNEFLRRNDVDVSLLWANIADMIVRTMLLSEPHILHAYRMCRPGVPSGSDSVCFEILGFDIMIDRKLRPWLLEINRSPSFGTDERLDFDIKSALIEDTFRLLNMKVSDKRRNIAAQKAEAQKRLFKTTRKGDHNETETDKRKMQTAKRKEELKEILTKVRRIASRDAYENRSMGRFRRVFPSDDPQRQERFCRILNQAFSVFLAGRGNSMQKEIQLNYANKYREDELLDMIAECEADERDSKVYMGGTGKPQRGPKPLQSMPESLPPAPDDEDGDENDDSDSPATSPDRRRSPTRSRHSLGSAGSGSRPGSGHTYNSQMNKNGPRPQSQSTMNGAPQRSISNTRPATLNKVSALQRSNVDDNFLDSMVKEREEELNKKTLSSLNEMHIKFPGKTDQEAELLLDQLTENWKFHKPRIASYWLVKLDSIKRRKVIDIVRSNVRAMLQRIWRTSDTDNLRLYRIFSRVFNRLLWSHGQGLWNCFSTHGNSWETIFSKSSENISETEMDCCRRIVQLCRDCLLIVYKFADEAKNPPASQSGSEISQDVNPAPASTTAPPPQNGFLAGRDLKPPMNWNPQPPYSQRYSKLYGSASFSNS